MAKTIDIAELIDQQKVSRYQVLVAFMAWLTLFLDGVDNQSIAYVAPALSRDWHLVRGALGTVFSSGVLGVAIGAFVIGPLADRFGRKRVTVSTVLYVALFTLVVTQIPAISAALAPVLPAADNVAVLTVLRFVIGLGLGAAVPLAVVIGNEFAPRRRRAAMVTLLSCGYAMGSFFGGFLASALVPRLGWQAQFYVASALTLAMAAVLGIFLPESIRLLTVQQKTAGIIRILQRINPRLSFGPDARFVLSQEQQEASAAKLRPLRLFLENRSASTVLIWLCLLMNTMALNYFNNWLPTLTVQTGLPQNKALFAAAFLQVGGMFGVISLGFLADVFGFFKVLFSSFALGAVFIASVGAAGGSQSLLIPAIFATGFCIIGTQITLAALAATLYPTDIRSTGVSWAHGFARVGSISAVQFAGVLLAQNWPLEAMYLMISIPMIFGCLWIGLMSNVRKAVASPRLGAGEAGRAAA